RANQAEQALVTSGDLAPQDFGLRSKPFDGFHFWQGKKFADTVNSPAAQNLKKVFRRFEGLNGQAAREGPSIVNNSRRLCSTGCEVSEVRRWSNAHHRAQTL